MDSITHMGCPLLRLPNRQATGSIEKVSAVLCTHEQMTLAASDCVAEQIGQRIRHEVLGTERAACGEQIVATVSRQLVAEFGSGFTDKNLRRMMQFAEAFPDKAIVAILWRQLS
jgi:hypothetical protein